MAGLRSVPITSSLQHAEPPSVISRRQENVSLPLRDVPRDRPSDITSHQSRLARTTNFPAPTKTREALHCLLRRTWCLASKVQRRPPWTSHDKHAAAVLVWRSRPFFSVPFRSSEGAESKRGELSVVCVMWRPRHDPENTKSLNPSNCSDSSCRILLTTSTCTDTYEPKAGIYTDADCAGRN